MFPKTISVASQRLIELNHPSPMVVGFVEFPHEVHILVHDTGSEDFFSRVSVIQINFE